MKSLEDLERAFERGLNAWESGIVGQQANRMGSKAVREIKRKTPVDTGNLRRRWRWEVEVADKGHEARIHLLNDADYAAPVNDGHRIVRGGKTVGKDEGHHMLEKGVEAYRSTYLQDDLQEMVDRLREKIQ